MGKEETAQDESGKTDEKALSSLAAMLEAKDDIDDKGGSDEKTGEALIGVNVIVEGTMYGAATDLAG